MRQRPLGQALGPGPTIPVCRATPCTHSRGTGHGPKYVQYEGLCPAPGGGT